MRLTRYGIALLLLAVAVRNLLAIYVLDFWLRPLIGGETGVGGLISDLKGGLSIFVVACAIAIVGAFGLFLRKAWGRVISMIACGLFALLELTMAVFSPESTQRWFSFFETRWVAATQVVLFSISLGWLFSPLAKREFRTNGKLT